MTLFWLPIEDTTLTWLGWVSAAWSVWLAGWLDTRLKVRFSRIGEVGRSVLAGGLAGLLLPLTALVLVLIKAGLHGHGFLDVSLFQLGQILSRVPWWGLLGCLGGGMLALVRGRLGR